MHKNVIKPSSGYSALRIPGLFRDSKGTVFLYCEARKTESDWADIDILLYKSTDNGSSFSPPAVLHKGSGSPLNNPVMLETEDNTLLFLFCKDYGIYNEIYLIKSSSGFTDYSEKINISDFFSHLDHNAFAFGPGHGERTSSGRLLVPFWYVKKSEGGNIKSHHPGNTGIAYSDDSGKTWKTREITIQNGADPNETSICVFGEQYVLLNIRCGSRKSRYFALSNDNGDSFSCAYDSGIADPVCFSGLCSDEKSIYLSNCDSVTERCNLVIRKSDIDLSGFKIIRSIDKEETGYSDISIINDNRLLIAYEKNGTIITEIYNSY